MNLSRECPGSVPATPAGLIRMAAILCASGLLGLGGCFKAEVAGTGTETSTKGVVVGRILNSDGTSASMTAVELIPDAFNPVQGDSTDILRDTTRADGGYRFKTRNPGRYKLQAVHLARRTRLLVTDLRSGEDSLQVAAGRLSEPGSIRVALPDSGFPEDGYLYVPGTTLAAAFDGDAGSVFLDSVPAGTLPSIVYAEKGKSGARVIRHDVAVASGEAVAVRQPAWARTRKLVLNTTASGAGVAGNVAAFPVLVRLDASNFPFSQAQAGGADIRFEKSDGARLPHQIEQWDADRGLAAVWVKLDTVFGNDGSQSITLYWANPGASDASDGAAVFDTSASVGFQGVWHMNQAGGARVLDATANRYHGTPEGLTPGASVEGVAGGAYALDGLAGAVLIDVRDTSDNRLNFPVSGPYTFAVWVNADSSDTQSGVIWDKGYVEPTEYYLRLAKSESFIFSVREAAGYNEREAPAGLRTWKHVVSVRNGNKQYLYVDGACVDSVGVFINSSGYPTTHGGTVVIGRSARSSQLFNYFRGKVDELQVSGRALGPDWIKLSHQNQRPGAHWVEFQ